MRTNCLDPAHYGCRADLSWNAMLRHTKCTLDLNSDPEMFSLIDLGIRGGVDDLTSARTGQQPLHEDV